MKIKNKAFQRASLALTAALVAVVAVVPALMGVASAAGQVATRSMEMSDSTPGQSVMPMVSSSVPVLRRNSVQ